MMDLYRTSLLFCTWSLHISDEKNMFIVEKYEKHTVYTDGGT